MHESIKNSSSYQKAKSKAKDYANDPDKLDDLIQKATTKANKKSRSSFLDLKDNLFSAFRLLKAYSSKKYNKLPWKSLLLILTSIIYFAMPLDVIPDFLIFLGITDDIALLAWTMKLVKSDLDDFKSWEEEQQQSDLP